MSRRSTMPRQTAKPKADRPSSPSAGKFVSAPHRVEERFAIDEPSISESMVSMVDASAIFLEFANNDGDVQSTHEADEAGQNSFATECDLDAMMAVMRVQSPTAPNVASLLATTVSETVVSDSAAPSIGAGELTQLGEMLRQEFRDSISELQSAQAAAIASQSEVLRTLTEMIFQSSASRENPEAVIERAFAGVEDRLIARMQSVSSASKSASTATAGNDAPAVAKALTNSSMQLKSGAGSVTQSWEQIRNEMIAKGDYEDAGVVPETRRPEKLHEVAQLSSDRHFRLPEQDPSLEIPKTVDADKLSESELREAFREREAFIGTLIARIRRQQESATGQLSAEQLQTLAKDLPDELAKQVRHTLKQMEDLARMGELELALERARIARQVNQLQHSKQVLEHNARQLGLNINPDGTVSAPASQPGKGSSSRRWLGKLGFGQ